MKLRFLAVLLALPSLLMADVTTINRSSFTRTNEARANITARHLDKIIVPIASAGGTLLIWSSTSTTAGSLTDAILISSISLATVFEYDYSNLQVRGITYQTNGNTNGITILYKN